MSSAAFDSLRVNTRGWVRERLAPAVLPFVWWLLVPIVGLLALAWSLESLAVHINSAPVGKTGTYRVTYHGCPNPQQCVTDGTFTSDDGSIGGESVLGLGSWQTGHTYRALSQYPYDYAIPVPGRWDPTQAVVGTAASVVVLGGWAFLARGAARDARRRRRVARVSA